MLNVNHIAVPIDVADFILQLILFYASSSTHFYAINIIFIKSN